MHDIFQLSSEVASSPGNNTVKHSGSWKRHNIELVNNRNRVLHTRSNKTRAGSNGNEASNGSGTEPDGTPLPLEPVILK